MENSKDRKPQNDVKHNGVEKMDSSQQEHWFSEDELSPAEESGSSAAKLHAEVFDRLYADFGLPSGTMWARDNVDASPFFFNFGEPVDSQSRMEVATIRCCIWRLLLPTKWLNC